MPEENQEDRTGLQSTGAEWSKMNESLPEESLLPTEATKDKLAYLRNEATKGWLLGQMEELAASSAISLQQAGHMIVDAIATGREWDQTEIAVARTVNQHDPMSSMRQVLQSPVDLLARAEVVSLEEAASFVLQNTTGLDLDSIHGKDTPARFLKMLRELTTPEPFEFRTFQDPDAGDEMIVIRDITFVSVCNHHVIPFHGRAHIGYVPNDDHLIAGLSKFARVVRYYAKQLQVQERLTNQIASYLEDKLTPKGVAVILEAEHMCMTIRGVQAPGTMTRTAAMKGVFADHDRTAKAEFLSAINGSHK